MMTRFRSYLLRVLLIGVWAFLVGLLTACATLKPNPTDSEIQQTRKLAVQIFSAIEVAGQSVQAVQSFEIGLHNSGKVSDDTHRAFQTDLLITARIVRSGLTSIQAATRTPELKMTVQTIVDNLKDLKTKYGGADQPQIGTMLDVTVSGLTIILAMLGA